MQLAVDRARHLRRDGTVAENRLWYALRSRQVAGAKFVRQFPIGPYSADFACRSAMLVVELDGGQHNGSTSDAVRTDYLRRQGYSVLRFWNNDVLTNRDGVAATIARILEGQVPEAVRFEPGDPSPGALRAPTSPRWGEE
jgi:very-short-patch-repair endonuclease